jgi:hypothetical protein
MRALLVSLALVGPLAGCDKCPNRAESARVTHALDVVLAAPNDRKAEPVEALAAAPCTSPQICSTRDRCVSAFRHLVEGVKTETNVKKAIGDLEQQGGSKERIAELDKELDRAEAELNLAKAEIPGCEQSASDLHRLCGP